AHIARIDSVLGQALRACRILLEQQMSVVVEVADDGNVDPDSLQTLDDVWHRLRSGIIVDRDAYNSEPARASAATCVIVPEISAVSVLVIDWTTTGASLPTFTFPIRTVAVFLRVISGMYALV